MQPNKIFQTISDIEMWDTNPEACHCKYLRNFMNQTPSPISMLGKFVEVLSTMYYNPKSREIKHKF